MKLMPLPSAEYLHACFVYEDGALTWRVRPREHFRSNRAHNMWNAKFAGKRAGFPMVGGRYRQVGINGNKFLEHRVIAAMHGIPTDAEIDHRDRTASNAVSNLRPATRSQNMRNTEGWAKKATRVGVFQRENGKWTAYIRADGKHKNLGTFETEEDAGKARESAERVFYGQFAAHAGEVQC
jgi:hypothetical protein